MMISVFVLLMLVSVVFSVCGVLMVLKFVGCVVW